MSTVNMSTPRWREYSIAVWIILIVIAGLVLWFGWPAIRAVIAIIQLYCAVLKHGPSTDGEF